MRRRLRRDITNTVRCGTEWIIIDTETDGLRAPIHVVEISAQRMCGWEPVGPGFRALLNHDVPIPWQAEAVHGYNRAFLREHGGDPRAVHREFAGYIGACPLVAHNLSYDWDRCLVPEWARLGLPGAGRRGFCSVALSRRVLRRGDVPGHGLQKLRAHFGLAPEARGHQAWGDVLVIVELCRDVLGPRLERAGVESFAAVAAFAGVTPLARCWERVAFAGQTAAAARRSVAVSSQPMQASVMETP